MKTGLVLEGGAFRTIFSSGVCDALLDAQVPLPDYTVGVSAGIAYGVSYLSRQSRRNLKLLTTFANDSRYMGVRNFVKPSNRCYFGLKFAYETIPNQLVPFDYDAFASYPGTVEAVVTNLESGEAEYLPVPRRDGHNLLLQATCAIPMMFPVIWLEGKPYLDGGCADPIPWKHALEQGCDPGCGGTDPGAGLPQTGGWNSSGAGPGVSSVSPFPCNHACPGGGVQPRPGRIVCDGESGADSGHCTGGYSGLPSDGAGSGGDPGALAIRLFCRTGSGGGDPDLLVRNV